MPDFRKQYYDIFEYLSAEELPTTPEPAVVFGRNDHRVAIALGDLIIPGLVTTAVISGGVGKDTGDLINRGFRSEADFLGQALKHDSVSRGYQIPRVLLEERAANGGENSKFSLDIISPDVDIETLTAVAHATSAQRLARTLKLNATRKSGKKSKVHVKPTSYNFNPTNALDVEEATAEFMRILEGPEKGYLFDENDLPQNLVDFVVDLGLQSPKQPPKWAGPTLRAIPNKKLRNWLIEKANR